MNDDPQIIFTISTTNKLGIEFEASYEADLIERAERDALTDLESAMLTHLGHLVESLELIQVMKFGLSEQVRKYH